MNKGLTLLFCSVSACCTFQAFAQNSNTSYLGLPKAGVDEPCKFDLDCLSEWCKIDSDAENSEGHCAAKLQDNSPCKEHKECQSYNCVEAKCVGFKRLRYLSESCSKHEECYSGRCGDEGSGNVCILKVKRGKSCDGDLQTLCKPFTVCDKDAGYLCVAEARANADECTIPAQCKSGVCIIRDLEKGESYDFLNPIVGSCIQYEDGHSCSDDANCSSGWCKKNSGPCTDNADKTKCCVPKISKGQTCSPDDDRCEFTLACDKTSETCVDESKKSNDRECTQDDECSSGWCHESAGKKLCRARLAAGAKCTGNENYCADKLKCDDTTHKCK